MSRKLIDLTGRIFGKLTVVSYAGRTGKNCRTLWNCHCACGVDCVRTGRYLCEHTENAECPNCYKAHRYAVVPPSVHTKIRADITGQRFGRLVAIERVAITKKYTALWRCICDCGNEKIVSLTALKRGITKSCGCLARELTSVRSKLLHTKHGKSNSRLYNIWSKMKQRCNNPNDKDHYSDYGGRGIQVCKEWNDSFEAFAIWAYSNGYKENLSIDRIENDGGYTPNNCRWTNALGQHEHVRNKISIRTGERTDFKALAEMYGIKRTTLHTRLHRGMSLEEALTTPYVPRKRKERNKNVCLQSEFDAKLS